MSEVFDFITRTITAAANAAGCAAVVWYIRTRRPAWPWLAWYWFAAAGAFSLAAFYTYGVIFGAPTVELRPWFQAWSRANAILFGCIALLAVWFRLIASHVLEQHE